MGLCIRLGTLTSTIPLILPDSFCSSSSLWPPLSLTVPLSLRSKWCCKNKFHSILWA
uniref:Uncharacterized protein n=1 Tax=Anguilla anguilla TaxID=7936 RepID=A0A0E9QSJ0_ANGAN